MAQAVGVPRALATGASTLRPVAASASGLSTIQATGAASLRKIESSGLASVIMQPSVGAASLRPIRAFGGNFADTFRIALRARLMEQPELAEIRDVYWNRVPLDAPYPYMVIDRVNEDPFVNLTDSYYEELALQFTVNSFDADQAERLGEAAWEALRPVPENPPLLFKTGYEMTRLPGARRGPVEQPGQGPAGENVWSYEFDYMFLIGKG
jgi:hypothetical protein